MSSTSPAVGRALDVLLYLAAKSGPASGAAIARDLKMPRSSTYHLLDVLIARGFVVHYPDERSYGLGMSAFEIGSAYLRHEPLEMLARPLLRRLVAHARRDRPPGCPARGGDPVPAQGAAHGVPHPGHPGHRYRSAAARAPDCQRALHPGAPAGRPGARAVSVDPRFRRSHRVRVRRRCRNCAGYWPRSGGSGGPRRSAW